MMFGTWLAVAYAVPRQWLPTVCAKTSWRPKPTTRAITVMPPMSAAARPIPRPAWRSGPGSVTEAGGPVTTVLSAAVCSGLPGVPRRGGSSGRPGTGAAGTGRRPSMSSHRRAGVRSMTAVKLTFSLAAVSPAIPGQQRHPGRPGQAGRGRHPEQGAERVGARVPEHRPFAQVFAQQRERRAKRGRHRLAAARCARPRATRPPPACARPRVGPSRPGPLRRVCRGQQRAAGQRHLEGAPRAQVEQVQQVGATGHQARVDGDVGRATAEQRGRHQARSRRCRRA